MQNHAPVIYAYAWLTALLREEARVPLPGPGERPPTERPDETEES